MQICWGLRDILQKSSLYVLILFPRHLLLIPIGKRLPGQVDLWFGSVTIPVFTGYMSALEEFVSRGAGVF